MNQLVGTWKLTDAKWVFDNGEAIEMYGPGPHGRSIFTADGWMSVILTGGTGPTPGGDPAAPPFTLAYSGSYVAETDRFVVDVDVSSMAQWVGTKQERAYEMDGNVHRIVLGMRNHPAHPDRPGRGTLQFTRE